MSKLTSLSSIVSLAILASVGFAVSGEEPPIVVPCADPGDCSVADRTGATFASGMMVWLDQRSGAFRRPTAEEARSSAEANNVSEELNRSFDGLVVEVLPNGTRRVKLEGRFMSAVKATVATDGSSLAHCGDKGSADSGSTLATAPAKW